MEQRASHPVGSDFSNQAEAAFLLLLFLSFGAIAMLPVTRDLIDLWLSDQLRSFGSFFPFLACALAVRAWRQTNWTTSGTPWGIVPLLAPIVLAHFYDFKLVVRILSVGTEPIKPSLYFFSYFSGVLLLLGGTRLWRRSLFALALLLMLNPVPYFFTTRVDLPLQGAAAGVARSFAHLLGMQPTGAEIDLMFTPRFGMTIVPGCNGLRGAATMAYIALIVAYLRRYRPAVIAVAAIAAGLLGYVLNFVRLCVLVVYYRAALAFPRAQANGEIVDYFIGGTLFVLVCLLAGMLWRGGRSADPGRPHAPVRWPAVLRRPRIATAASLLLVGVLMEAPSLNAMRTRRATASMQDVMATMPAQAGPWTRVETRSEVLAGTTSWVWSTYRRPGYRDAYVGVWLSPAKHYLSDSLRIRGTPATWQGDMQATATAETPMHFSTMVAMQQVVEDAPPAPTFMAETTCLLTVCSYRAAPAGDTHWITLRRGPAAMRSDLHLNVAMNLYHDGEITLSQQDRDADMREIRDLAQYLDVQAMVRRLGQP